jgi:hypothetical protein
MALTNRSFLVFDPTGQPIDPTLSCGLFLYNSVPWMGYGSWYDKLGYGPGYIDSGIFYDTNDDPVVDPSVMTFLISSLTDKRLGSFPLPDIRKTAGAIAVIGVAPLIPDELRDTGNMIYNRSDCTVTVLVDGKILVTGGNDFANTPDASCERYDPVLNAWSAAASMSEARYRHAAVRLANGKVLVAGGDSGSGVTDTCEIYDSVADTWTATGAMVAARSEHGLVLLPSGRVLAMGGQDGDDLDSAEIYDPTAGTWAATGAMAYARTKFGCWLLVASGLVLVAGANNTNGRRTETYDPATGVWTTGPLMSERRCDFASYVDDEDWVYVFGGRGAGDTAVCEMRDPSDGSWSTFSELPLARSGTSAVLMPSGDVIAVFGGAAIDLYKISTDTWTTAVSALTSLSGENGRKSIAVPLGALIPRPNTDDGLQVPAVIFVEEVAPGEPRWITEAIFLEDNSNLFWAWRVVDSGTKERWTGDPPTIENYCNITTGALVTPVPTVSTLGNGLFIATPSSGDIAEGVRGWLKCVPGSVISGDFGVTDGRLTGQAFVSLPLTLATDSPRIIYTRPDSGEEDVSEHVQISAHFNVSMDPATMTGSSVYLMQGSTPVACTISSEALAVTLHPSAPLAYGTVYTATVTTAIATPEGVHLVAGRFWDFTISEGLNFVMRAFHTVYPTGHVYWTVSGVPDATAEHAPYPAGELTDIVVIREFMPL